MLRSSLRTLSSAVCLSLLVAAPAWAAPTWPPSPRGAEMVADRPGFADSTRQVAERHLLTEFGAEYVDLRGRERFLPLTALARYGVPGFLEARLSWSPFLHYHPDRALPKGEAGSLGAGLKWATTLGPSTELALVPTLTLPAWPGDLGHDGAGLSLGASWAHALDAKLSLGGKLLLDAAALGGEYDEVWTFAASLGANYAFSAPLTVFAEVYSYFPLDGVAQPYLAGGASYQVKRWLQVDGSLALGLADASHGIIAGGGAALLF